MSVSRLQITFMLLSSGVSCTLDFGVCFSFFNWLNTQRRAWGLQVLKGFKNITKIIMVMIEIKSLDWKGYICTDRWRRACYYHSGKTGSSQQCWEVGVSAKWPVHRENPNFIVALGRGQQMEMLWSLTWPTQCLHLKCARLSTVMFLPSQEGVILCFGLQDRSRH